MLKKIIWYTSLRIFPDFCECRRALPSEFGVARLGWAAWLLHFVKSRGKLTNKHAAFSFLQFSSVSLNVLSSVLAHTDDVQSSRESTVACNWVFISDFHFFFIPLDRRGIQPSAAAPHAGSIYAVIVRVYLATARHVRSRASQLNTRATSIGETRY